MGFVVSGIAHHFYREVKLLSILKSCELFQSLHLFVNGRERVFGYTISFQFIAAVTVEPTVAVPESGHTARVSTDWPVIATVPAAL